MNSMRSGVLVCVLLACAWCGWAAEIAVESRSLTIRLASPEEGMGVVGLAHRPSGTRFLKAPESASAALLWKLELTTDLADDDAFFGLTNRNRTGVRSVGREGDDLLLSWDKIDLPDEPDALDVQVRITPRGRHGLGEWRIRVVNRSKRVGIYRVIFPVLELGRIGADGGDDWLLAPPAEGRAVRDPLSGANSGSMKYWDLATDGAPVVRKVSDGYGFGSLRPHGLPYPTARGQVQFCAYYEKAGRDAYHPAAEKGAGLYLATYDGAPHPKVFFLSPDRARGVLTCEVAHYPESSAAPGAGYEQPYPVILDGFLGDWYDAASLYRSWAVRQRWCAKGPLHARGDVPEWLKNVTAVLRFDTRRYDNKAAISLAAAYRDTLPGALLVQWYSWAEVEKTKGRSTYAFPPVAEAAEGFREIIEKLASQRVYVMPYVNARLWAARRDGYEEALPYAARSRNGERHSYGVVKDDKVSGAAYMCVQTPFWQDYVLGVCRDMKRKYSVPALYLDQQTGAHFGGCLALGGAQESGGCFDPAHGHPLGVTRAMIEAEHARVQAILDTLSSKDTLFPLCGEGTDETMIGLTPVKLIHYEIWPGYVPIFGRVYHDYITSFGRTAPLAPQKIAGDPGPAMSIGWQLVLGNQIGRLWQISPKRLAEPVVATHLEYVRKACEVRDQFSQYLCLGEMQRPPRISGDVPELTTHEFRRLDGTVTLPSILAGTWRAPDGRVAVVVTNISRRNIAFTLQLDVAELGLAGAGASLVPRYPRAGQSIQERDKMFRHETSLDGLAVRLYEIVVPE